MNFALVQSQFKASAEKSWELASSFCGIKEVWDLLSIIEKECNSAAGGNTTILHVHVALVSPNKTNVKLVEIAGEKIAQGGTLRRNHLPTAQTTTTTRTL